MSEFVAGFAARHDAAGDLLRQAFGSPIGFAPVDPRERLKAQRASAPTAPPESGPGPAAGPKHFHPADPGRNPTAGWDPLDAASEPVGFVDPIEAAHAAGYAEGVAAAQAEATRAHGRDAALLAGLASALGEGRRIDREAVARQLRHTVLFLVTKIVGDVGIAPERLAARIEAASELLADQAESALLRVHPDDVALLEGRLPKSVFAAGDAAVPRGSFVLESASTIVEDGPDMWLDQLAAAIDRAPVPELVSAQ